MSDKPSPLSNVVILLSALLLLTTMLLSCLAAVPKIATAVHGDRLVEIYFAVRKPFMKLVFGTDMDLPWRHVLVDYLLVWTSLFLTINAFIYRKERVVLWGHIKKNYCSRTSPNWLGRTVCTLVRYCGASLALPYACVRIYLQSFQERRTLFTSCYITLNPEEIARYLKYLGYAIAAIAAGAAVAGLFATDTAPRL